MPLQNRVVPTGEIVATSARGAFMGNRGGPLHDSDRKLGARRWVSRQWICCRLAFKDRRRVVMTPGRYTELFFLDEATALAAGHRPCFECRRADAVAFQRAWAAGNGLAAPPRAADIDRVLHRERTRTSGERPIASLEDLPDGVIFECPETGACRLVSGRSTLEWTANGYYAPRDRTMGPVVLLTPPSTIATLLAGYRPQLHETARSGSSPTVTSKVDESRLRPAAR